MTAGGIRIGLLLLLVCGQPGAGAAQDLLSAIRAAAPGDTILVLPGTYTGNLLLDRRVVLIGMGNPVVRGEGRGSVMTITADSCTVRGIVIEHSGPMLVNEDAGILLKSRGNLIEGNDLRDILFGIYLFHADRNTVRGNRIRGRTALDLGERGSGIHIWNSERNQFRGNDIADVRDGFYIQNAGHSLIERNRAYNLRYGVHYMYADSNVFLYNSFSGNVAGGAIMYSRGIVMRHNVFSHNRGFASFGILFQDCHGLEADSNVVSDNAVGLFFEASTDNTFRHNVIARNDVALQMFQNSVNNTFTGNNFIDNLSPLTIVGKTTGTRWSEGGRGNYWSDYQGYDLDGDGIGDVPMKIQSLFDYLEGQNGNTRLYLYSPASQALAAAAKAFPILDITMEVDSVPSVRPVDLGTLPAVRLAASDHPSAVDEQHGQKAWVAFPLAAAAAAWLVFRPRARRKHS
jgi:nitrous oxidase accessory protein